VKLARLKHTCPLLLKEHFIVGGGVNPMLPILSPIAERFIMVKACSTQFWFPFQHCFHWFNCEVYCSSERLGAIKLLVTRNLAGVRYRDRCGQGRE
jgi:hypothetical protein